MNWFNRIFGAEELPIHIEPAHDPDAFKILFVCMGNICRSPTAEGVFRHMAQDAGLTRLHLDSAGTHEYHKNAAPDRRAQLRAAARGYDLSALRARAIALEDYERFDMILAMDRMNIKALKEQCPAPFQDKLRLFMEFSARYSDGEVPDPYYGGNQGFEEVLDRVEDAARGLLEDLRRRGIGGS